MKLLSSTMLAFALLTDGSLADAAPASAENELVPPAVIVPEHRRITDNIRDLLDLRLCTDHQIAINQILLTTMARILDLGSIDDNCDHMKAAILPQLQHCVLETTGIPHTIYAGAVFDVGVVFSYSGVMGVYIDSDGRFGCFKTDCQGFGFNIGVGVGAVGGVLVGNAKDDFPGAGFGTEFGGDWGHGVDIAGGFTSGGKLYAELSMGVGIGVSAGIQNCNTSPYGEVHVANDWIGAEDKHCGGNNVIILADGTLDGWAPPNGDKKHCEAKCTFDDECEAFVWRDRDSKCFWKKNVTAVTLKDQEGHTCHRPAWLEAPGRHCGGADVNPLADGTPYGWAPPNANIDLCEEKCHADPECEAFVWRQSQDKCYWKKDVHSTTFWLAEKHDCHHRLPALIKTGEAHCGGDNVDSLTDGTPYGWAPPDENVWECEEKCTTDPDCEAFVWKESVAKCYWKSGVASSTLYELSGHTCFSHFYVGGEAPPAPSPAAPAPVAQTPSPPSEGLPPVGPWTVDVLRRLASVFDDEANKLSVGN